MTDLPQTCPDHPRALIRHSWRTTQLEWADGEPATAPAGLGAGPIWTEDHRYWCAVCGKELSEAPYGRRWRKRTPEELAAIAKEVRRA
jgi:hypothetical protein